MRGQWLSESIFFDDSFLFPIPRAVEFIYRLHPELVTKYDLTTVSGRLKLYSWWLSVGRYRFFSFSWSLSELDKQYFLEHAKQNKFVSSLDSLAPADRLSWWLGEEFFSVEMIAKWSKLLIISPASLLDIWSTRSDLQAVYDLSNFSGRRGLVTWWSLYGCEEYPDLGNFILNLKEEMHLLDSPGVEVVEFDSKAVGVNDSVIFCLDSLAPADRLSWWLGEEFFSVEMIAKWSKLLITSPNALLYIWRIRPDLQAIYDLSNFSGRRGLLTWWSLHGCAEYVGLAEWLLSEEKRLPSNVVNLECLLSAPGVNVIGFASGVLGIGEDARTASATIQDLDIPVSIVEPGISGGPATSSEYQLKGVSKTENYPVSLFCLPAPEMIRLALEGNLNLVESNTYKIGAWPWEFAFWPKAFSKIAYMVDEVWAQSDFVAKSFSILKEERPIEIYHIPLVVEIPSPTENVRYKYALPDRDFLFYAVFDGNSWLTRKNPIAAVKAFQQAFPLTRGVGLVIKAMNVRPEQPMWAEILSMASRDSRIYIIQDRVSRQEVINLMSSCNAYISLHRSEGFGRVIAESMLLGLPTVVTNYSGNVDFCTKETAFLVEGDLIAVGEADYILSEGQHWCDPDISQAAASLREVIDNPQKAKMISETGKNMIQTHFSRSAVGALYQARFAEIFKKIGCS